MMKEDLHSSSNPNADSRNQSESQPNPSLIAPVEKININKISYLPLRPKQQSWSTKLWNAHNETKKDRIEGDNFQGRNNTGRLTQNHGDKIKLSVIIEK